MRLVKFLATAGVASRRACEEIVRAGRVTVGGQPVTDPAREVSLEDRVELDGRDVHGEPGRVVYALNKPAGVVSTVSDPQRRRTVVSLIPSSLRLYPVGRLDIDSTGLILLTNDGELAHRLTHPRFEVPKTYRAVLARPPVRERSLQALRAGVELEDGRTAPAQVTRVSGDTIDLTIKEGRKRQVKRMCEHVGHPVRRLERLKFGGLELGGLEPGGYRRLSGAELRLLTDAATGDRRGAGSSW